jgi:hypothetical protein
MSLTPRAKCVSTILATSAMLLPPASLAASPRTVRRAHAAGSVLQSRQLWATINVCNPKDQPDIVGVRGSMPSDGKRQDTMYMSFRLQYLNSTIKHWADLADTTPSFVYVGRGGGRQGGQSFQLKPIAGKPAVMLRGLVEFQWRRGKKVLQSTRRPTTAGHRSLAGADPPTFSAATCLIG